jgi:hypothetical protein
MELSHCLLNLPLCRFYAARIWLAKKPRHLVAGFISKDKFCLTDTFIGFSLLHYITITTTTTTTTNITDTTKYIGYGLDGPGIKSR